MLFYGILWYHILSLLEVPYLIRVLLWINVRFNLIIGTSSWHYNERHGISNHQPNDCLLNHLFSFCFCFEWQIMVVLRYAIWSNIWCKFFATLNHSIVISDLYICLDIFCKSYHEKWFYSPFLKQIFLPFFFHKSLSNVPVKIFIAISCIPTISLNNWGSGPILLTGINFQNKKIKSNILLLSTSSACVTK